MIHLFTWLLILLWCSEDTSHYQPTFGVCTKLSQYPTVRDAGYDYIEPTVSDFLAPDKDDSTFYSNLATFKQLDAKIISCVNFLPGHLKITGTETYHEDILVFAETAFKRAQLAGVPHIVFGSGTARRIPDGFDKKEATKQFTELCKKLAPLAEKYNVTVVVEPLNTKETNLINSLQEGAEIVASVDHPNIQLLCDIYHMLQDDEPASEIIKYGKYIRHCHIAEKGTRAAPGTDKVDFTPYFKALEEIKYSGCICIECRWNDFETQVAPALQYMKQQISSL